MHSLKLELCHTTKQALRTTDAFSKNEILFSSSMFYGPIPWSHLSPKTSLKLLSQFLFQLRGVFGLRDMSGEVSPNHNFSLVHIQVLLSFPNVTARSSYIPKILNCKVKRLRFQVTKCGYCEFSSRGSSLLFFIIKSNNLLNLCLYCRSTETSHF